MSSIRKHGRMIKKYDAQDKVLFSIEAALDRLNLEDGMTISFHHHFREGDTVVNTVVEALANVGLKNLILFASSLGKVHAPLIHWIKEGVISEIHTSGLRGELAQFISQGGLEKPVVIRSHGGRARAIEAGEMKIDVAFLAVPSSDYMGNANGMGPKTKCGSLGYAMVDAAYADTVVLLTDHLADYPNMPAHIEQSQVDLVIKMDSVGDPAGIASGATRFTNNPKELKIAESAADIITALPWYKNGFSFQTGSGGAALAVSRFLEKHMTKDQIVASFVMGGTTQPIIDMLEKGLIRHLFDTQSFDLVSIDSAFKNPNHHVVSASDYANPSTMGCLASQLDFVILSALEIDLNFNVNVMTGSDGVIMGASGGHCDIAQSSKCAIVVAPLYRGRLATVVNEVTTIITPGHTVDVLVTDRGIAVNPLRVDILEGLHAKGIVTRTIQALYDEVTQLLGKPEPIDFSDRVVVHIEYRDGSIIDTVKMLSGQS